LRAGGKTGAYGTGNESWRRKEVREHILKTYIVEGEGSTSSLFQTGRGGRSRIEKRDTYQKSRKKVGGGGKELGEGKGRNVRAENRSEESRFPEKCRKGTPSTGKKGPFHSRLGGGSEKEIGKPNALRKKSRLLRGREKKAHLEKRVAVKKKRKKNGQA